MNERNIMALKSLIQFNQFQLKSFLDWEIKLAILKDLLTELNWNWFFNEIFRLRGFENDFFKTFFRLRDQPAILIDLLTELNWNWFFKEVI